MSFFSLAGLGNELGIFLYLHSMSLTLPVSHSNYDSQLLLLLSNVEQIDWEW
jgi:hypothetical protein